MVQIIRHGIGKEDHTYTTIKGLPEVMPDLTCQHTLGFDNIELYKEYDQLPYAQQIRYLNNAIYDVFQEYTKFEIKTWKTEFIIKQNFITINFNKGSKLTEAEADILAKFATTFQENIITKVLKYYFCDAKHQSGLFTFTFYIRNCGFKMNSEGEVQEEVQKEEGEVQGEVQKPIGEVQTKVQNNKKSTQKSTDESTEPEGRSTDESTLKPIDLRLNNEIKLLLKEEANNLPLTHYLSDLVLTKKRISFECFERINTILSTEPKKNARIQFKVPSEKKEELQEEAKKKKITLTKHLFQIILQNMKDTRTVKSTDASTSNQNKHKDPVERLNLKNRKLEAKVEKLQKEKKHLETIIKKMLPDFKKYRINISFTQEQIKLINKLGMEIKHDRKKD